MKFLLGTGNRNKAQEILSIWQKIMSETGADHELVFPWDLQGTPPDPEENGRTLSQNAYIKAKAFAEFYGLPAIADDTGLFVDALDGGPGIFAARYAGEGCTYDDNVAKMLREMKDIADGLRTARFMSIACLSMPGGEKDNAVFCRGILEGSIARERSGSGGFGYDPIFHLPDGRSLAELTANEKNSISHRGIAMRELFRTIAASKTGLRRH